MQQNDSVKRVLALLMASMLIGGLVFAAPSTDAARLFADATWRTAASGHGLSALSGELDDQGLASGARRVQIDVPDGPPLHFVLDGLQRRGRSDVVWRGHVDGEANSEATITLTDGLVFGRILHTDAVYELTSRCTDTTITLAVTRLDTARLPACETGTSEGIRRTIEVDGASARPPVSSCGGLTIIDLLSVYSTEAITAVGGTAEVEALIQASADAANSAFIQSQMAIRYRLVHVAPVAYTTSGSLSSDLTWVRTDAAVTVLRDQYGADMVSLVVAAGSCGIGYVQQNPGPGFAPYAFQVSDVDCILGNLTFAHEHGHNLGMEHNPESTSTLPGDASYPWSFGHYVPGEFRTVMCYPVCGGCPRVSRFSSAPVLYAGQSTGVTDTRENARTGDLVGPIVANFRPTVVDGPSTGVEIATGDDDVAESSSDGAVSFTSNALELGEGAEPQTVGLRFVGIEVPQGATITRAYLEFVVGAVGTIPTSVDIRAEAVDDAGPFNSTPYDVTNRPVTTAATTWNIPSWDVVGQVKPSPDITAIVQEVIDRPGWSSRNAMVFVIGGTGSREAESYEARPGEAPLLHLGFSCPQACGNSITEPGEDCDDGNSDNCDGCSSTCQLESCGDALLCPGEACDDGNNDDCDGCSFTCQFESCGDAILCPGEACDDANSANCDGCSSTCQTDACGDGILCPGEACDDGNTTNGDGCDASCRLEGACCDSFAGCTDVSLANCLGAYNGDGSACSDMPDPCNCNVTAIGPVQQLLAVKSATAQDVVMTWLPDVNASDGYDVWYVPADKTLLPACGAACNPADVQVCSPTGSSNCTHVSVVDGPGGELFFYNVIGVCAGLQGSP